MCVQRAAAAQFLLGIGSLVLRRQSAGEGASESPVAASASKVTACASQVAADGGCVLVGRS